MTMHEQPIIHLTDAQAKRAQRLLGLEAHNVFRNQMSMHELPTGDWIIRWEEFTIVRSSHPVIDAILGNPPPDTTDLHTPWRKP